MSEAKLDTTTMIETNFFSEGMVKDLSTSFTKKGTWSHARNAVNNNHNGELGVLGNEQANKLCALAPYQIIKLSPLNDDKWVVFSTDDTNSEIGVFDESQCSYVKVVNDSCLGFKQANTINAITKENADCTNSVYWTDAGNSDRMMNLSRPPYKKLPQTKIADNCDVQYSDRIDCSLLAMSRVVVSPEINLRKGTSAGSLPNGTYQAVIAYTMNGIKVSDYFTPSNPQSLFTHANMTGSLELRIDGIDTNFDEFELVIISNINLQASAKKLGIYSTRQTLISIDYINQTLPTVPLEFITSQTPIYDKSDSMVEVNDYLLRVGVRTKSDFNYQPQANLIQPHWVAVELPANYYTKGGNLTSYMRDEQQPFFIRWIYDSAKRSAAYPIIGRASVAGDLVNVSGEDVYEHEDGDELIPKWVSENTATVLNLNQYALPEGRVIAEGKMGYWESTEKYPQNPSVWGDLCGKNIRHSKFPDNTLVPHMSEDGSKIIILGVKFENIQHPVDMNSDPISDIVGYEILRANREGNKTIVAKGILNNMGEYTLPEGLSDKKGLYPNYPYNDLRIDPFLSQEPVKGGCAAKGYKQMGSFRKDAFTFHSPETQFRNPFLASSELKIYGELSGNVVGGFESVYKHPRSKLIRDFALIVSGYVGIGTGLLSVIGKETTVKRGSTTNTTNLVAVGVVTSIFSPPAQVIADKAKILALKTAYKAADAAYRASAILVGPNEVLKKVRDLAEEAYTSAAFPLLNGTSGTEDKTTETTAYSNIPLPLRVLGGLGLFTFYAAQGMEATLEIIKKLIPFRQYALQYNSHGFYNKFTPAVAGNMRRKILESEYLDPQIQEFAGKYNINNLFRGRQVVLETSREIDNPKIQDNTRQTLGQRRAWNSPFGKVTTNTSAHYGALKIPMKNQFGQIDSMSLLPASTKVEFTDTIKGKKFKSSVIFGGGVYINRYTEKNSFFYFNDWMYDLNDGTEWNYNNHYNVPNPRFWVNTEEYDLSQLTSALMKANFKENVLPNDLAQLDRNPKDCKSKAGFSINNAYFYLFNNGVRDFFVESEINTAFRDYDNLDSQRHYDFDSYTDITALFRSDIIKSGNHFKYDYSLSVNKLLLNTISWGSVLGRDYDPFNQKCYTYYPDRVIYSLQQQDELKKDNWLVFLANNYKDFSSKITTIQSVNKTGALILFENDSPLMFQGVDTLQTDGGTKITIGDGGLFEQAPQAITNANRAYEYGSCQNARAVENTPAGLFWMSVNQGKIFSYTNGMQDITIGMKYWFAQYLPFRLLVDFPDFTLRDNSIVGIASQMIYDNTNEILYFCKKDYELKSKYKGLVVNIGENTFKYGIIVFYLGDPEYFWDASFTISYDVKEKKWISFHDWHPEFLLPSKTHFLSVKDNGIWRHNQRCDLFCNFYGVDYPFEVEYNQATGQETTTVRSLEYQLECYKYFNECRDAHHMLDENFDRMIVHNSEQISGLIKLTVKPKNSPMSIIQNTQRNAESVSMFCSKEEGKYRVNGINDLTRDRGEFSGRERQIWITEPNGYKKDINPINIDYNKSVLKSKKMRHYDNKIFFRKNISGSSKLLLKIVNTKLLKSAR